MDADLQRFAHPTYTIRRKFFKIFGEAFHIYDPEDNIVLYTKMKAFKLKEDIRLYASEAMERELLVISARQMLDIGATYDVFDPVSNEKVGSLRRKGLKSTFLRDEWVIMDENDREIGLAQEDSTVKALVRRFIDDIAFLLPQKFDVTVGGKKVMTLRQRFNPLIQRLVVDFTHDTDGVLDRRLGLAIGVLISAIEGRQG